MGNTMQIIFGPSSHYDSAVVNRHSVITIDLLHITYPLGILG